MHPNLTELTNEYRGIFAPDGADCQGWDEPFRKKRVRPPVEGKLNRYLRSGIFTTPGIAHQYRSKSTDFFIGSKVKNFRLRLQARIRGRYTWETLGRDWELKHIVGLDHFNLHELLQVRMAWHWSNLVLAGKGDTTRQFNRNRFFLEKNRLYNVVREPDWLFNPWAIQFEAWEGSDADEAAKPRWAYRLNG